MVSSLRLYLGKENSKYAIMVGGAIVMLTSLFTVLTMLGFTITGSDDVCLGTLEDPCVSYGQICNRLSKHVDIYNTESISMDFDPTIKDYWLFFKDGRVKKEFLIPQGIQASTVGWRFENFTNETKPRSDRVYVHRFSAYSCQDYMLIGLKNNPKDVIKWGIGVMDLDYLDPIWNSFNDSTTSGNITFPIDGNSQLIWVNITENRTAISATLHLKGYQDKNK